MASKKKIVEMIAAIKTIYPYYAKETDVQLLVSTWEAILKEYQDEVIAAAFFECLKVCKMPPTPADVIEQIRQFSKANEQTDEELWSIYIDALRETERLVYSFRYTYVDESGLSQGDKARKKVDCIWAGLPEKLKMYLASKGELIRNSQNLVDDMKWERNRFMKVMPTLQKRVEYQQIISSGLFALPGAKEE